MNNNINQKIGETFGFLTFGPLGAIWGRVIGKSFDEIFQQQSNIKKPGYSKPIKDDRRQKGSANRELNVTFFNCLFLIMGKTLQKCRLIRKSELKQLHIVMDHMRLSVDLRLDAINQFYKGQQSDFSYEDTLKILTEICHRRVNLTRMFIEILLQSIHKNGEFIEDGKKEIYIIAKYLGIEIQELKQIKSLVDSYNKHLIKKRGNPAFELRNAYDVLGLERNCNKEDLKKQYKKLMNQHHPDKLTSKGFPQELCLIATEKTQEIKNAYELIMKTK